MGIFEKDRDLTEAPTDARFVVDSSVFRVKAKGFGMRLDKFLAHHLNWRSRSSVQTLIKDGYVSVVAARPEAPDGAGQPKVEPRPGARLLHGARVVIRIPDEYRTLLLGETKDELTILYEDAHALGLDKPPLIAVHPSGRHMTDTLIQRVHMRFKEDIEGGLLLPRLCHRLDRETSGVVLVSKRPGTHAMLSTQFEDRKVEKDYLAILDGELPESEGSIDAPIRLSTRSEVELQMTTAADGLACRTDWRVLEVAHGRSLVKLRIHTGRQHQIRVHMAALGVPLVGDKLYGPDNTIFLRSVAGEMTDYDRELMVIERHALHSHRLVFQSPDAAQPTEVTSDLPGDLRAAFPEFT